MHRHHLPHFAPLPPSILLFFASQLPTALLRADFLFFGFVSSKDLYFLVPSFGRPALFGATKGGQYLIDWFPCSNSFRLSMQKSFKECTSCGYCFLHISVVHHSGIKLLGVSPLILALFTTATMWWHGSPSTHGALHLHPPKWEPKRVFLRKKHLRCLPLPRLTLHSHLSSHSAMSI